MGRQSNDGFDLHHAGAVLVVFAVLFAALLLPPVLDGRMLALGDGLLYSLPPLLVEPAPWTPLIFAGYPVAADPQMFLNYPVARLLPRSVLGFNLFVILPYLLASCFLYGFVFQLTRSRLGAAVAGVGLGLSGFMVAHMGTLSRLHAVAWGVLFLWMIERNRSSGSGRTLAVGGAAVALCALAGHPQTLARILVFGGFYALIRASGATRGWWRFLARQAVAVIFGLAAAAVLLVPMFELGLGSAREHDFEFFTSGSMPVLQLPGLLFPNLFGSWPTLLNDTVYFGDWYVSDTSGFLGSGILFLALTAVLSGRRKKLVLPLAAAALVAGVLALGDATPLIKIIFQIPGLRFFRAPSRYIFEMSLSLAVLAGIAVQQLEGARRPQRLQMLGRGSVALLATVTAALLMILFTAPERLAAAADAGRLAEVSSLFWKAAVIGLPLGLMLLVVASCWWWARGPSPARAMVVALMVTGELLQFGWLHDVRLFPTARSVLEAPPKVSELGSRAAASHQRLASLLGRNMAPADGRPNLTWLWGLDHASGYSPLVPKRYADLMSMRRWGEVPRSTLAVNHRGFDLVGVRFLLVPKHRREWMMPEHQDPPSTTIEDFVWPEPNLDLVLGEACGRPRGNSVSLPLPQVTADRLGIVSFLACSADKEQLLPVLKAQFEGPAGTTSVRLQAGVHTAEWAWERPSLEGRRGHQLGPVFTSRARETDGEHFSGHSYSAVLDLASAGPWQRLTLEWTGGRGSATIRKIALFDRQSGRSHLIGPADLRQLDRRWALIDEWDGTDVYENRQSMPRAWLVSEALVVEAEQARKTVVTSRLPDGRVFDPRTLALVEQGLALSGADLLGAEVDVIDISGGSMELKVRAPAKALLVLGDLLYPGWTATVDGAEASVVAVDSILRGVPVPGGEHLVKLEYQPRSRTIGLMASSVGWLALLALAVISTVASTESAPPLPNPRTG